MKWVKVFKNGPSKTCGRQSLKNFVESENIWKTKKQSQKKKKKTSMYSMFSY